MNKTPDSHKLTNLQELDVLLPREIRGQSHTIPRIVSAVRRGELGLTKPSRPRGSFLLLGPTGVGKTETVVVTTNHVFGIILSSAFEQASHYDIIWYVKVNNLLSRLV